MGELSEQDFQVRRGQRKAIHLYCLFMAFFSCHRSKVSRIMKKSGVVVKQDLHEKTREQLVK